MHSGAERAISRCQPHEIPCPTEKVSKRNRRKRWKAAILGMCFGLAHHTQASHLHRVRRGKINEQLKMKKERARKRRAGQRFPKSRMETNGICPLEGRGTHQVKSGCYSPNFVEQTAHCDHSPGAPFSWAASDETKASALPRSKPWPGRWKRSETSRGRPPEIQQATIIL